MKKKNIEFKIGKDVLRGSLFIPDGKGPFPGVIFYHGRYSSRIRYLNMAEPLAKKGLVTLAFDFRGCGESDGLRSEQTLEKGIEDGKSALEFLLTQNVHKDRIGIQGNSFGGFVTGNILKNFNQIKSVVLRAPAAYGKRYMTSMTLTPDKFFSKKENWFDSPSYEGIRGFKGELLVLESANDELLPKELVQRYYKEAINAKKRKLIIIKGVGHKIAEPKGAEIFYKQVIDWFLKTL